MESCRPVHDDYRRYGQYTSDQRGARGYHVKSGKTYESDKDNLRVGCASATNLLIKFEFYSCHDRLPREYRYVLP